MKGVMPIPPPIQILPRTAVVEVEAAVGALDRHFLADLQPVAEAPGMVAQRLGDETDAPRSLLPGGGDGVGMRPFRAVGGGEGELAGLVTGPALRHLDLGLERLHTGVVLQRHDAAAHPAAGADATQQHDHRRTGSGRQQHRHDPADR